MKLVGVGGAGAAEVGGTLHKPGRPAKQAQLPGFHSMPAVPNTGESSAAQVRCRHAQRRQGCEVARK